MSKRVVLGSMQCEGNTLTPVLTCLEDFDIRKGEDMYERIHVLDMLKAEGLEPVPTIFAEALPGGPVRKADFVGMVNNLVSRIPDSDIGGVWLYLHGAMQVEEIGSGEEYLLEEIRRKIGKDIPISVGMDFHADNSDRTLALANCINGFRTAPHTDRVETERLCMKNLIACMKKKILPSPQYTRCPVVIAGDAVLTAEEPLKTIMAEAKRMEETIPGMLSVQVFNGQPWVDQPYMGPNMVVTHESDKALAKKCADELAMMYYRKRKEFRFLIDAETPEKAIETAWNAKESQVYISDSGDNTTAGAAGDDAFMLNRLIRSGHDRILVAGIMDKAACDKCYAAKIGDELTLKVGGSLDKRSESAVVTGTLKSRGNIISYTGLDGGHAAVLDCGKITLIITEKRTAVTSPVCYDSVGLDVKPFKIIVVKLGYLFPELEKVAQRSILAFTPGSSTERLEDMHMKNISRPMFPLDDNFWD